MLLYIICLVVASTVVADSQPAVVPELDPPYCAVRYRRLCKGKGKHVACQFPTPGPGESCVNYTLIKFTKDLRYFVTHYINRRRQRLAMGNERVRGGVHLPRPEVMMQVEWDRELALLAQRLADQCSFVHDDCRATVRFPYAGQTVGEVKWRRTSESENLNVARAVRRVLDAWWGERRRVTASQLIHPFRLTNKGNAWGHFSQLAVWRLRAVGCGAVKHGNIYPKILLVCDFSHTNMLGQRTLVPGPQGRCPIHTARQQRSSYPTLCAPVRHQEIDGTNTNIQQPKDYETENDERTNDGDEEIKNYEEEGFDNLISENTTVYEANEYTLPSEQHKLDAHQQVQIQQEESGTVNSSDPESEGNDISQDNENDSSEGEPKVKESIYKIKKMRYKMKPSEQTKQEDENTSRQSPDDEKEQERTGSYQIKRLRNRGKSREKGNAQESVKPFEHQDFKINEFRKVQNSKNKDKADSYYSERSDEIDSFEEGTSKNYMIKKIHDKDREHHGDQDQYPDISQPLEREKNYQHKDQTKRKELYESARPVGRDRFLMTEKVPERDLLSLKKIPDKIRNFQPLNMIGKEMIPERIRLPERVPSREEPPESERQPDISSEERYLDRVRPVDRFMQRPPKEDASLDFKLTPEERKPETIIFEDPEELSIRREPTTEKQRTRYMLKLGDIQIQQKNFDLKNSRKGGSNRQKEFRRIQDNQMDKLNLELAQENYKEPPLEDQFHRVKPVYVPNKHRMTEFVDEASKDLLGGLKTLTSTVELRRTQFYEPVGLRHRWRPNKDRPERPGARALITNAYMYTSTRPLAPKKHSATLASIMMDKDDVEQLFKDTGFNPNWKQYKKILT